MILHNTLTKKLEKFEPIKPNEVGMYNCGPTVYDYAHIGNLRAYIFTDILRRTLESEGYRVKQVMNITDLGHLSDDADEGEDKMLKALKREGKAITLEAMIDLGKFYTNKFFGDFKKLNIELPTQSPKASDHIAEDIELIKTLEEKGFTYKTSDGMYFEIKKFHSYGKLGNIDIDSLKSGARVDTNSEKKHPADFALWKFNEIGFESPWGKGFPGWHIECSAMAKKYLGQPFDIHTGGIDHIGTHHNGEIAQSESAYEKPLAKYWLHSEHLVMQGGKMSKSAGEFITLETLEDRGIDPLAFRYYVLSAHYRSLITFSFEALEGNSSAYARLLNTLAGFPDGGKINNSYLERFKTHMSNDLKTPEAIALMWELLKDKKVKDSDKKATVIEFDKVFGLDIEANCKSTFTPLEVPSEVTSLLEERESARAKKDFRKADKIREKITDLGYEIKDTEEGAKLRKI